jgi:hypothetical protein
VSENGGFTSKHGCLSGEMMIDHDWPVDGMFFPIIFRQNHIAMLLLKGINQPSN